MLRLYFNNGTAWAKMIEVEGSPKDDLLRLIEKYIIENPDEFRKYNFLELYKNYSEEEISEQFIPINGGEYYIDNIIGIEVVEYKIISR